AAVSGEVTGIKKDLIATREDLDRQLVDVKNVLSEGIAKNSGELAQLRKKGERDYFEFDIRRNSKQPLQRVADVQLGLLKTDPKTHKYSIAIQVDDNRLEKRDRTANEPVQFLVGRDELRYEVVVNSVEKDRIRGYVSAPKDKVLSAEGPKFREQELRLQAPVSTGAYSRIIECCCPDESPMRYSQEVGCRVLAL